MDSITLNGIPRDLESATALALKKDDPTRKEFEKWAVLTYSNNKARPNEKKGSDGGIDGIGFIYDNLHTNQYKKMLISVKSGKPTVSHIRDLLGTVEREKDAVVGVYITLQKPTQPMIEEAAKAGRWRSELFNMEIPRIEIVTVEEILQGKKIHYLVNKEVVKKASRQAEKDTQTSIDI
jgi:site-specific DNA-methyltransferase (adenine-specific)